MINLGVTKQKILVELKGEPKHGYEIGKSLSLNTSTVYEHMEDLEDQDFVESDRSEGSEGKINYNLTEKGRKIVEALEM